MPTHTLNADDHLLARLKLWSELQARQLYFVNQQLVRELALPPVDGKDRLPDSSPADADNVTAFETLDSPPNEVDEDIDWDEVADDVALQRFEHPSEIAADKTQPCLEGIPIKSAIDGELPEDWLVMPQGLERPVNLDYASAPLGNMLDETARRFADKPAVLFQDTQWRYRDFLGLVNRVAGGLGSLGVRAGDRVMSTLPNCPEFMAFFFAVQKLGAIVVNTGPLASPEDIDQTIDLTRPKLLIGLDLQSPQLAKTTKLDQLEHLIWVTLKDYQPLFTRFGYMIKKWQTSQLETNTPQKSWQTLMAEAPSRPPSVSPDMEAVALLQPTGGTTGTLKLAQLSHRNLLANALQLNVLMQSPPGQDRYLAVLPMFHVFGLSTCLITPILNGGSIVPLTRFVPGQLMDALARYRPTIFPLVPAICRSLCNVVKSDAKKYSSEVMKGYFDSVRICVAGAAPLTSEVAEEFESMSGVTLLQGFGMTESAPVTACNVPESYRHASIGHPLPDTVIRVADMADPSVTLPRGEVGEMLVAGPQVMRGYYRNSEQTAKVLWEDASGVIWLRTGDLAMIDPAESLERADLPALRIVGRKKHMIIRNGFNIYPEKLEKVILSHEDVQDAAVIGRPDKDQGEQVIAAIILQNQAKLTEVETDQKLEQLRDYCRKNLGRYEQPGEFVCVEELPRNGLGKFQAHRLKDQLNIEPHMAAENVMQEAETVD